MARIQDMAQYLHDYNRTQGQINCNHYNGGHGHHFKSKSPGAVIDVDRHYPTPTATGQKSRIDSGLNSEKDSAAAADWNWSFCIVSLPFILLGFPIHLMLGTSTGPMTVHEDHEGNRKETEIATTSAWLESIFIPFNCLRIIASMIIFAIGCGIQTYFGFIVWNLLYNLVYLGEINAIVFTSMQQLLRILPVVIPLVFFWLRGYIVKNVLDSFNSIFASFAKAFHNTWKNHGDDDDQDDENDEKPGSRPSGPRPGPGTLRTKLPSTSFWCRLLQLYTAIIILHGLQLFLTITTTNLFRGYDFYYHLVTRSQIWIGYAFEIMNSLVLPVYCMFCWILHSELELLIGYLNLLVYYESRPNFTVFNEIKFLYKKIARQIMAVNKVFSLYLSWLFFLVSGFAAITVGEAGLKFVKYLTVTPVPPELPPQWFGGDSANTQNPILAAAAALSAMGPEKSEVTSEEAAVVMRETLATLLIALLQYGLLGYTAFQAINVNKAARSLHVILNDFVTYQMSNAMTTELYQAFRLLKAFIHSTMERFEDPALLRIPILNYTPYFGVKLHSYQLRF